MATVQTPATIDDLACVSGKAELIDGRIVFLMPLARKPGRVGGRIYQSLDDYATARPFPITWASSYPGSRPAANRSLPMRRFTSDRDVNWIFG